MLGSAWLALSLQAASPSIGEQLALEWSAPPSCPTADNVRQKIDHYLSRNEYERLSETRISGTVEPSGGGQFRLTLRIHTPEGDSERTISSGTCDPFDRAAALVIAVALDPLRIVTIVEEHPEVKEAEAEAPPTPDPLAVIEAPERPRRRGPDLSLSLGGGAESGMLPRVGPLLQLYGALRWKRVELGLGGSYLTPREVTPFHPVSRRRRNSTGRLRESRWLLCSWGPAHQSSPLSGHGGGCAS